MDRVRDPADGPQGMDLHGQWGGIGQEVRSWLHRHDPARRQVHRVRRGGLAFLGRAPCLPALRGGILPRAPPMTSPRPADGPRLLDLFCGAGGAAMGYHRAGFARIVGVDIKPLPAVECSHHAEIRKPSLPGLRQGPSRSGARWEANQRAVPSVRRSPSCSLKAGILGQPRGASSLEGRHPHRGEWLPLRSGSARQPVSANGRCSRQGL